MTSAPSARQVSVSPELWEFFQVELRNEAIMRVEAESKGRADEFPPQSTLGSAHDSLCQAPDDVLHDWFWGYIHPENPQDYSVTHTLIEFGMLLERYGDDALLEDFTNEDA